LANIYLPKQDGSTTEIDLIMISETGIYVIESKNYSGWIFGSEKDRNWTQTFRNGQKFRFYNPIWQNRGHISAVKNIIGMDDEFLYRSYIVFSERCTLKKINIDSPTVRVIKREEFMEYMRRDLYELRKILSIGEINDIYQQLQQYSLVDDATKEAHINQMKFKKYGR